MGQIVAAHRLDRVTVDREVGEVDVHAARRRRERIRHEQSLGRVRLAIEIEAGQRAGGHHGVAFEQRRAPARVRDLKVVRTRSNVARLRDVTDGGRRLQIDVFVDQQPAIDEHVVGDRVVRTVRHRGDVRDVIGVRAGLDQQRRLGRAGLLLVGDEAPGDLLRAARRERAERGADDQVRVAARRLVHRDLLLHPRWSAAGGERKVDCRKWRQKN
jgi:hypothetical protein